MLGITSTILFSFATIHISVSLQQLLEAFIYIPPGASPLYSTLYWADDTTSLSIIKDVLYDTTVRTRGFDNKALSDFSLTTGLAARHCARMCLYAVGSANYSFRDW